MRKTFAIALGLFLSLSLSTYAEESKLGDLGKNASGGAAAGAGGGAAGGSNHLHIAPLTGDGPGHIPQLIKPTTKKPVASESQQQKGRQ